MSGARTKDFALHSFLKLGIRTLIFENYSWIITAYIGRLGQAQCFFSRQIEGLVEVKFMRSACLESQHKSLCSG